ncbi:MAG: PTS sugar transporter subunit IIB [Firmicutes bacterium]|nr:PTS sugar transporter subunit IIB [Bacillota bacterium]
MSLIHVRIDDRLIHGQVAMIWTHSLGATRIMVVDDEASRSDLIKMSLKLATPNGISLSVLTVQKAAERIKQGVYEGQRVLLIIKTPGKLIELIQQGVSITEANLGNLSSKPTELELSERLSLSSKDVTDCKVLMSKGILLTKRLLPTDENQAIAL